MVKTSLQHLQLVVYIFDIVIATIAICCRLWARRIKRTRWQMNDYLMVVAYVAVFATLIFALSMVTQNKLGVHGADLQLKHYLAIVKSVGRANFIMSTLMMLATTMVKMSITELYLHLFPQTWLHRICHVQLVSLALFMVAQLTAYFMICQPLASLYDFSIEGKCGDIVSFWLAVSLIALFFDISCVVLPIPIFWKLSIDRNKKWKLTMLFGLGFW
ncbi:hypothetical protein DER46DRAFT_662221 [Fusarium sp. MPI-SDFR-AT-0072]|nr:hypothetical protein DER46DRAFT_662221 [Fusarium sp. MPI-SDFR-AT-0072]